MALPGSLQLTLRAEQALLGLGAAAAFIWLGYGWLTFLLLVLLPDLSMLGYLVSPRFGAITYNAAHTWLTPIALAALAFLGFAWALPAALIFAAHIGIDRAIGYGLKLPSGFKDTHLGAIGPT